MKASVIVVYALGIAAIVAAVAVLDIRAHESTEKSLRRRLGETATYIVTFADRNVAPWDRCYALAEARGGTVSGVYEGVNACSLILPRAEVGVQAQGEIAAFGDPSVLLFEEDQKVYAWDGKEGVNSHSSSAHRLTQQASVTTSVWGLDRINQCSVTRDNIATPQDASNVIVFIIDTGILGTHNEFANPNVMGSDCHFSAVGTDPLRDGNGHGTHVAGTVCGKTYGVAKSCTLCAVQVLGSSGGGTTSDVISGINHAISKCNSLTAGTNKRCVINMSLGGGYSSSLNTAVKNAVEAGIVVVVAAGNDNVDACTKSPASESTAITVGSTTSSDIESSFSNHGSCVDIFAPGSSIKSAWSSSNTATSTISGTSMASPHVAGIAAGILSSNTNFSPADVRNLIVNRADGIPSNLKLATVVDCGQTPTAKPPTSKPTPKPTYKPSFTSTFTPTSTPTTSEPTTSKPTMMQPAGSAPTSNPSNPTTANPTTPKPTTTGPTSLTPTSARPTTSIPSMRSPTTKPSFRPSNRPTTRRPTSALFAPTCTVNTPGSSTSRTCVKRNGVMFDVFAKGATDVFITSIATHVDSGTLAEIWTRNGTSIGYEANKNNWTKIRNFTFSATGIQTIPLSQAVTVTAGQRRAFYVTMIASDKYIRYGKNYTGDSASSTVVEDSHVLVYAGSAVKYPFVDDFVSPRFFVGSIEYYIN